MALERVDHVHVETRRFEPALRFWQALGFGVESRWGEGGHRAARLTSGEATVVLAEASSPVGLTVHLGVSEGPALAERLADVSDVTVTTPWSPTHWGTRWMRVRDPDGNEWALEET